MNSWKIPSVHCPSVLTVGVFSTKVPSIFKNWFCHVLPMFWVCVNSRVSVCTSKILVSSPLRSDDIKVMRTDPVCFWNRLQSLGNQLLKLGFRHLLKLIGILAKSKSHVSRHFSKWSYVKEISCRSSLINIICDDTNILFLVGNLEILFWNDQNFTNISHLQFLNCLMFPTWKVRRKLDGASLEHSKRYSYDHFFAIESFSIRT